ncbi:MAG: hypothetical protein ACYCO9_02045 [Streptosporangiaceae bacterium]
MRHLLGFVLALGLSAALFFGAGAGVWLFTIPHGAAAGLTAHDLTRPATAWPLAGLIGAGLLMSILIAVRRVSPIGPGLPGLALLAWSGLLVARGSAALRLVPLSGSHYAAGFTTMLHGGVLALIGASMCVPLLMPSRWRRAFRPESADVDDEVDVEEALGLAE